MDFLFRILTLTPLPVLPPNLNTYPNLKLNLILTLILTLALTTTQTLTVLTLIIIHNILWKFPAKHTKGKNPIYKL